MKQLLSALFLLISFFYLNHHAAYATGSPAPIMAHSNDYFMAYPGILPDNPLYKLKVLRDKVAAMLITDPQKKVDFYVLQTDKQIGMITPLVKKKEIDLAKSTALKGENNFTQLIFVYKDNGIKPSINMYKKLQQAAAKHQEVLTNVMHAVNAEDAKTFQQVIDFSKTNIDSLTRIYNGQPLP